MGKAPTTCHYCDGEGNSAAGGSCGFCEGGKPLDTQEDWDRTWGHTFAIMEMDLSEFLARYAKEND